MAVIYNPELECMDPEQRRALQSERLVDTVRRVYQNVAPYRAKMDAAGVEPGDIRSIDDLPKLPFTVKDDLREAYPFGLFAVPMEEVVRVHSSSGTTGKPTVVGYTAYDVHEVWAETMARTLGCAGATASDVVQVAYGYGLFTGGLGVHYGAERLGAATVPASSGNTQRQLMLMQDFGTTILACTPSYLLYIIDVCEEVGIDPRKDLKLKAAIPGAEPWTDEMRRSIEDKLGIMALDIYGLSEIIGPGVASEGPEKQGLHVNEDHFFPEIINPETGEPVADGEKGELVFTCLTKQALPLIRYRTRDISRLMRGTVASGRTLVRMERVSGRTDDMLIIRGINVFPSQIESVIVGIDGIEPHYELVVRREEHLDTLEVRVEVSPEVFSDEVRRMEALRERIRGDIQSTLTIATKVTLCEPRSIPRSEGKAKRVIDLRDKQ